MINLCPNQTLNISELTNIIIKHWKPKQKIVDLGKKSKLKIWTVELVCHVKKH